MCALGCVSLLVSGCSKALAPSFRAVGVRELELSNDRSIIEFTIEATNPNKEPIPLRQIRYRVEINGVELYSGVRSPETTLNTFSTQTFTLPAVLPASVMSGTGEVGYALIGSAEYIPPGRLAEVLFDAEVKVPEVEFNLSGTINTTGNTTSKDEPTSDSSE